MKNITMVVEKRKLRSIIEKIKKKLRKEKEKGIENWINLKKKI